MGLGSRSAVALTMLARWGDRSPWSSEGRGGDWSFARVPREITLDDAYAAVEQGRILSRHAHPPSDACEVGRTICALLETEFREAERGMEERLGRTTIAHLLRQMLAIEREFTPANR